MLRFEAGRLDVESEGGVVTLLINNSAVVLPLGASGSVPESELWAEDWSESPFLGLGLFIAFLFMLLGFCFPLLAAGYFSPFWRERKGEEDKLGVFDDWFRVAFSFLSPLRGALFRQRADTLIMVLGVFLPLFWGAAVAISMQETSVFPLFFFTRVFLGLVFSVLVIRDVVAVFSGVDFNLNRILSKLPLDSGVELGGHISGMDGWLSKMDVRLLRLIENKGISAALLESGYRSSKPVFLTWNIRHKNREEWNEQILARLNNLYCYGYIRRDGVGVYLTELGLRVLALPEFFVQPMHPAALLEWLAGVEHRMGLPGQAIGATVDLMVNLESSLKKAIVELCSKDPNLITEVFSFDKAKVSSSDYLVLKGEGSNPESWMGWAASKLNIDPNVLDKTMCSLHRNALWQWRLGQVEKIARIHLNEDVRKDGGDWEGVCSRLNQLPPLLIKRPWPAEFKKIQQREMTFLLHAVTLGPLFQSLWKCLDLSPTPHLRVMSERLSSLRNHFVHDKSDKPGANSGEAIRMAYEAMWLSRPLLFGLNEVFVKKGVSSDVWLLGA